MRQKLKVSVSKDPQIAGVVTCRNRTIRERFLSLLFGDRKRMRIIKAVAAAGLDKDQMKQVANAVRSGLLENEVIDIINSGFDAEEMEQAVEIVLAEKSY